MAVVNISGYKFITLNDCETLQYELQQVASTQQLLGTILLAEEGMNVMMAGSKAGIDAFIQFLHQDARFSDLQFKYSYSEAMPFERLKVRIKPEIITMGMSDIKPEQHTVTHLKAAEFKQWYESNKDMVVIDTRNHCEIEHGSFDKAIDLNIDSFKEFPKAASELSDDIKQKPVVIFCTGGVRCEKAGPAMTQAGFKEVYQLDGGIIKYFEECGGEHYQGNCFVFDERIAIDSNLNVVTSA